MQKSLLVLAFVAAVSAQAGLSLPSCATTCVTEQLPTDCNGDPECICSSAGFIDAISCCVSKACDTEGQEAALAYARSICQPAGVTTLPTAAGCTATSSSAAVSSGSAAASATSSGASSETTSDQAADSSSSGSGSSSGSSSAESEAATTTASASASASSSGSSEESSATTSSGAAAATTSNAANLLSVQGAGVACAAGLLGLAGLL